ncbi:MAG TPA: hypothetical protein VIZ43_08490 [Trebonia sp.]
MTDSPTAAVPDATSGETELDRLRRIGLAKGLTIRRTSIGGYRYTITDGVTTPRFVTDADDAQRVISEEFG